MGGELKLLIVLGSAPGYEDKFPPLQPYPFILKGDTDQRLMVGFQFMCLVVLHESESQEYKTMPN